MIRPFVVVLMAAILAGCGTFGGGQDRNSDDRFAKPGTPKTSPSGDYTVVVEHGPPDNGAQTWVAVVKDKSGREVYRDPENFSVRQGISITWLSNADQLWLLSHDIGSAYVEKDAAGKWTKTVIYPENIGDMPDEIKAIDNR